MTFLEVCDFRQMLTLLENVDIPRKPHISLKMFNMFNKLNMLTSFVNQLWSDIGRPTENVELSVTAEPK